MATAGIAAGRCHQPSGRLHMAASSAGLRGRAGPRVGASRDGNSRRASCRNSSISRRVAQYLYCKLDISAVLQEDSKAYDFHPECRDVTTDRGAARGHTNTHHSTNLELHYRYLPDIRGRDGVVASPSIRPSALKGGRRGATSGAASFGCPGTTCWCW